MLQPTSAVARKPTLGSCVISAVKGQQQTQCSAAKRRLFDHNVGEGEHGRGHGEANRLGGFQIDRQVELYRILYRQVCGFLAFQDAVDITCGLPVLVDGIGTVGDQPAVCRPVVTTLCGAVAFPIDEFPRVHAGLTPARVHRTSAS
jgi:hypothetical protein